MNEHREAIVLGLYNQSMMNTGEAQRILDKKGIHVSRSQIADVWRNAGYEVGKHGGRRYNAEKISEEERQRIARRYNMYNGNATLAAKSLGYNRRVIASVWRRAGLDTRTIDSVVE